MNITPLTQIVGAPDSLIIALNTRLRQIASTPIGNTTNNTTVVNHTTTGSTIVNLDIAVTAAITYVVGTSPIPMAPSPPAKMYGFFTQDATGHVATFGADFRETPAVDPTPLMVSIYEWVLRAGGVWWCTNSVLGVHP